MDNAEVISRLQASKGQIARIARETGVSERTLRKIYSGETPDPRGLTLDPVREWFQRNPGSQ